MRKELFIGVALLLLGSEGLKAQESINSAGAEATGSGGTVNFSIGQVMYAAQTSSSGSVTVGAQQPFVISVVSGFDNANIQVSAIAYPNPTSNELKLKVNNLENFVYQLLDVRGNIVYAQSVSQNSITIEMKELPPAIYILKVISLSSVVKTFKIIKN